jgi:hypothetical protein
MSFAEPIGLNRKSGAAEGSAVLSTSICSGWKLHRNLCHPERSRGICGSLNQHLLWMEAPPSPLSSRAQPRDLQFRGPFLEMFFDRAYPDFLLRCSDNGLVCGFP